MFDKTCGDNYNVVYLWENRKDMKTIELLKGVVREQIYQHDETPYKPNYVCVEVNRFERVARIALVSTDPDIDGDCGELIDYVKQIDAGDALEEYFGKDHGYKRVGYTETEVGDISKWVRDDYPDWAEDIEWE